MKKVVLSFVLMSLFALAGQNAWAQKYFVYDGDTFSVMLTCNNNNTRVLEVSFSANNEWNKFAITDYEDLEGSDDGGFIYTVKDGEGQAFTIDYYRTKDHILVTNSATGDKWKLYRRDE